MAHSLDEIPRSLGVMVIGAEADKYEPLLAINSRGRGWPGS